MDGPRVIMLSVISQRKTLLLSLTCGILEVKQMNTTKTDTENKLVVTNGKWGEAKRVELKRYKLLCIKRVKKKDILRCTGKYSHCSVLTLNTV